MRALLLACFAAPLLQAQGRLSLSGTWELAAEPRASATTYDRKIEVPCAWETVLGTQFDGIAWYRRVLPLTPQMQGAQVRVEFAAAATLATVFCNGKEVGHHLGGWTPFRVDVTDALQWQGNDVLEVKVDEKVGHNTQGFLPVIEPHFGGIWQDVTLCIDRAPVLDHVALFAFGKAGFKGAEPFGDVDCRVQALPFPKAAGPRVRVEVLDGARAIATAEQAADAAGVTQLPLHLDTVRPWAPGAPNLYGLRVTLRGADDRELDRVERRVGFRSLAAKDTVVLWNGKALQMRGVLHWGYSPPSLAPSLDPAHWRRQLEDFKSLGFNTVKCCLWVPPSGFYELCDELGLLVWQEYPTWHPHMDAAHKQELHDEYEEFFQADGSHPSVAIRSLTCETGQGAALEVVQDLFDACHRAVPDTLVVDDSSWIGWQRVTDFWDEHPYGNNAWWPGRLAEFQKHIAEKGKKPLLLGECIAADTWADRQQWLTAHGEEALWWRPDCFADQARFETWLTGQFGAGVLASLGPVSRDYAMLTRKYQIEKLRATIPEAGYVVSVARDFAKARMGLYDDFDHLKWQPRDWAWQRDVMLSLTTENDRRAFRGALRLPVAPTAFTLRPVDTFVGELHLQLTNGPQVLSEATLPVRFGPDVKVSPAVLTGDVPGDAKGPQRVHLTGELRGRPLTPGGPLELLAANSWDLWWLPLFEEREWPSVRVADHVDLATLDFLEQGGRVYLRVTGQKGCLLSDSMWYLKGAPFAPPHAVHATVPAEMLLELQAFDLDGGRLMPWAPLLDQVDPILAFWEAHDIPEVHAHLSAFDCQVGKGRLLASCLDEESAAGRYVRAAFLRHLAEGPAPRRSLSPQTLAALRGQLTGRQIDLPDWRFRTDPKDEGRVGNWQDPKTDVVAAPWRNLKAGSHWENQAKDLEHYDGVAWYRVDVPVPPDWQDQDARAVFEGIDDSATVWLNGEQVGSFGDPATNKTVWLERSVAELGRKLRLGATNVLVLRVVDHGGSGGLWKPVYLTTGPADPGSKLLH